MKLHVHNYRTTDWYFEQPCEYEEFSLYCDYKIMKCRCGKQKRVNVNIYTAELRRVSISAWLSVLNLVNKISVI